MPAGTSYVTPEINLLPEDDLESKPGGKFLKWALTWGKRIVILTELLVVMAFLSRFKLDSDVAGNSEEIDRRKTIILASSDFENQFRSVQERIGKVKTIESLPSVVTIYDLTRSLIPAQITINDFTVNNRLVSIDGNGDDQLLTVMVAAFKSSSDFSDVVLEKITKQNSVAGVGFSLKAYYSKKGT